MPAVRTLTLAEIAWPRPGFARDALLVVGATFATALAAQIAIPLPGSPVPITAQTFAVLLSGAVLGARRAFLAQILYLAEGALGLPAFAGGAASAGVLLGPSGGYLLSFPLAAVITGALAERGWDRRFATMLVAMLLGSLAIFAGGLAGLARFVPTDRLLALGLLPFVPGDLIKAGLAAAAFPAAWKMVERRSGIGE
jgi:biotin transport system substrate-specific component